MGHWLPWNPSADEIQDQEYLEGELNDLMKEYKKNQDQKDKLRPLPLQRLGRKQCAV